MPITFHILDALSRDQITTITRETEEEQEVELEFEDEEQISRRWSPPQHEKQTRGMVVHLFGMTAEGESIRCDVEGFRPYLYVEVPASMDKFTFLEKIRLNEDTKNQVPKSLKVEAEKRKKLYGYYADSQFTFFKLSVGSLRDFRVLKNLLLDNWQRSKLYLSPKSPKAAAVYESGLDPLLRFFHLRDIQPCGWVTVKSPEEQDDSLGGQKVYTCSWEDIGPEAAPPKPSAPFKSLFWDIECYSRSGEFPVAKPAKKGDLGDPIIQIGNVLKESDGSISRVIFVVGKCDKIDTAEVRAFHKGKTEEENEREMLKAWFDWLIATNPDIWVGYNIFGFDEKYVWHRAEVLGLTEHPTLQLLSRLQGHGGDVKLNEKRLSSSALGDNFLYTLSLQGRLQVDLYHVVKRGYQLPSYKLDEVTKYFMSGKLKKVTRDVIVDAASGEAVTTWLIQTSALGNAKAGRSLMLLDETGDEITDKLPILEVSPAGIRVQPSEADLEVDTDLAVKWVIVKDDVSPADIFRLHRGSPKDRALVAAYCVQDCELTMDLYNKLETFTNAMCMANVCTVPVTMIFTRGQGVKIESLIFKFCDRERLTIETLVSPPFNASEADEDAPVEAQESYEGAIVLDPVPGFYTQSPIGVCDFASLYPSTIESENISYDSLLWVKDYYTKDEQGREIPKAERKEVLNWGSEEYTAAGEKLGVRWLDISFTIWKADPADTRKVPKKIAMGTRVCRYAQPPNGGKSALPIIVRNLLAARAAKRAEIKKESDPFRKALLDAEQLAYKLTANSLYGQLGSGTFKVRLQHLAASVTAYGRKQILFAKAAIEKFYGPEARDPRCCAKVVYGDTDSLFVEFNPRNPETGERLHGREALQAVIDITTEAGHFVTKALKPPHDFEFDKAFYPFIIFSKKRYVGNMYEENADEYVQKSMGIATKRRDYAPIVKTVYGGAVKILLTERDVGKAAEFVRGWVKSLVDNKVSLNQLLLTKSLRAEYKTPTPPAHKVLADRIAARDPGNAPASGDRLSFVYFKTPPGFVGATGTQGDRVETPAYMKANGLAPDPEFYIDHQLVSPVGQLFSILVDQLPDVRPPAKGWAADPEVRAAEMEIYAKEYLFDFVRNKGKKNTLLDMWGYAKPAAPQAQSKIVRGAQAAAVAARAAANGDGGPTTRSMAKQMTLFGPRISPTDELLKDKRTVKAARSAKGKDTGKSKA